MLHWIQLSKDPVRGQSLLILYAILGNSRQIKICYWFFRKLIFLTVFTNFSFTHMNTQSSRSIYSSYFVSLPLK